MQIESDIELVYSTFTPFDSFLVYSVNGKFKTRYSKATNYLAFLHTLILCVVISKYRLVEDEYIVAIVYNCNETS